MPQRVCAAHDELKELLDSKLTALHAEVKASHEILYMEMKGIQKRQDLANHRTNKLEERMDKLAPAEWIIRNWRWAAVGLACFILFVISVDLKQFISLLKP